MAKLRQIISQRGNLPIPSTHINWFRKTGLIGSHDSKIRLEISFFDDNTLSELAKLINGSKFQPSSHLRHAMLKSRFSDTISKTNRSTTLIQVDHNQHIHRTKVGFKRVLNNAVKPTREKKEASIKVNAQREEARKALSNMNNTAAIYDNCWILRELHSVGITDCYPCPSVLQNIGLFFKEEDCIEQLQICQYQDMELEEG
ncbi:hypothetical protein ACHQM5_020699 [Ranunculus cassubicifolius]